jgi:hypothetical protein
VLDVHPTHNTRISDASSFDEICDRCGATDFPGSDRLAHPCPGPPGDLIFPPCPVPADDDLVRRHIEATLAKQQEILGVLAARTVLANGYDTAGLALYAEQVSPEKTAFSFGFNTGTVLRSTIKNFLDAAREHYVGETHRLTDALKELERSQLAKTPEEMAASQTRYAADWQKAHKELLGARWTLFHTGTLARYLEQHYAPAAIPPAAPPAGGEGPGSPSGAAECVRDHGPGCGC